MKNIYTLFLLFSVPLFLQAQSSFGLQRDWGTYFGDERFEAMASETDSDNNLYIAGYVKTDVTAQYNYFDNAPHQNTYGGGAADGFIAKFNPLGQLVWATLVGGEGGDTIRAMTIDSNNDLYVYGHTNSTTGIASSDGYQPVNAGGYDFFMAKFSAQGNRIWGSYFGGSNNEGANDLFHGSAHSTAGKESHIVSDNNQYLYITGYLLSSEVFTGAILGSSSNSFIAKLSMTDGQLLWAIRYGANWSFITGLDLCGGDLYVSGQSFDVPIPPFSTYFATAETFQPNPGSWADAFLSKFDTDGQRVWSTYYGGSSQEQSDENTVKCLSGNIFMTGRTSSDTGMATAGAHQEELQGMTASFLTRFNKDENGTYIRDWGTYYGAFTQGTTSNLGYYSTLNIDTNGFIYVSGSTRCIANITSEGAYQEEISGENVTNAFAGKFTDEGDLVWGTYYNGEANTRLAKIYPYNDSFYLTGYTLSNTGMATEDGLQPEREVYEEFGVDIKYCIFITHFSPTNVSVEEQLQARARVYPNPVKDVLYFDFQDTIIEKVVLFDALGKVVLEEKNTTNSLSVSHLQKGNYILKIFSDKGVRIEKIIIN